MKIFNLLNLLEKSNVKISLVDNNLKISGSKNDITGEILDEIKSKKMLLIKYLRSKQPIFHSILSTEKKQYYKVSSAQKRLFVLQKLEESSTKYNISYSINLGNTIEISHIESIFTKLAEIHLALRTCFIIHDNEPVQKICDSITIPVVRIDSDSPNLNDFVQPFDLSHAPLFRIGIAESADGNQILLIDSHHIINDGVSLKILEKDFFELYKGNSIETNRLTYLDYSEYQNSSFFCEKIKSEESYWLSKVAKKIPTLQLPTDFLRPEILNDDANRLGFMLNQEESQIVKNLAGKNHLTLYMTFMWLFSLFLNKISGQNEFALGMTVEGRGSQELEGIVGIFINTVPIVVEIDHSQTISESISRLKKTMLEALDNQYYPFEDLVDKGNAKRVIGRNPFFDVQVTQQYFADNSFNGIGIGTPSKANRRFDLTLNFADLGDSIYIDFQYWCSIFKTPTINNFVVFFREMIRTLGFNTNGLISKIGILNQLQRTEILSFGNQIGNNNVINNSKTIHELFEAQERNCPENIALVYGKEVITYKELNSSANYLATVLLRDYMLVQNDCVAIVMDRTPLSIVSMLAVLKAGASFLPLDFQTPFSRLMLMFQEAKPKVILTDSYCQHHFDTFNELKMDDNFVFTKDIFANLDILIAPNSLAYTIFTSGSTGKPKGVCVEQKSIVNYLTWANQYYFKNGNGFNFALFTSLSFDLTLTAIFTTLLRGDIIHIYDSNMNIDMVLEDVFSEGNLVNALKMTPSHVNLLKGLNLKNNKINTVILGGEKVMPWHISSLKSINPQMVLYNEYGPTECTIGCIINKIDNEFDTSIGRPIDNAIAYVVDINENLQPIGIWGELYIGGECLASRYMNDEEATREKFVKDPFMRQGSIYKTGDIVRWNNDGKLEYLGRNDEQIKINGYRIEINEIEHVLMEHEDILNCAVKIFTKEGTKYMCAYLVSNNLYVTDQIRNYLLSKLPNFMIPNNFVRVTELPLTINGKIDKRKLPSPDNNSHKKITPPKNEIEKKVLIIWSKVLNIEENVIGTNNSIFELGGHSLMVIKILVSVRNEFNVKVSVEDVYKVPTIASLASIIERKIFILNSQNQEDNINQIII